MLKISNLSVTVEDTPIVRDLSFAIPAGEAHAVMGPNGSGKSTLALALAGHPSYEITSGTTTLDGVELFELEPHERAAHGLFLAFQYPAAIPGVSVSHFLRLAVQAQQRARGESPVQVAPFLRELREQLKALQMPLSFAERSVNDGFSGGEKKRLELLQMLMLKPKLVVMDEIDSGLDIDALKLVATAVSRLREQQPATSFLIITHYQRLLNHIVPDAVHVMKAGELVQSGGPDLALHLEEKGYEHIRA
jgi:Fe-S cluster assembly ATP-binding protein